MSEKLNEIMNCVIDGDDEAIVDLIEDALNDSISADEILNKGLIAAMDIVGPKMETGEMFIPEVLMAADTMGIALDRLKPLLSEGGMSSSGKVIIGTVEGDLHDIGKNLVAMMLNISGFEVIDLGVDQPVQAFLDACEKEKPDIIGLSALLTTTMSAMKETVSKIKEKYSNVKVIIGGAPVSEDFAKTVNADGYSDDAGGAVVLCRKLLQ